MVVFKNGKFDKIVLIDLGLSNYFSDTESIKTIVGTWEYTAPEVFNG